jgi:hypothetical protein
MIDINADSLILTNVPTPKFHIIDGSSRTFDKFHRKELKTRFKIEHNLKEYENFIQIQDEVESIFEYVIENMLSEGQPEDLFSINIFNNLLEPEIYIAPTKIKNFKIRTILSRIEHIAQSNRAFLLDGVLGAEIILSENINGIGKRRKISKAPKSFTEDSFSKLSTVTIKNDDYSCGYRAIFVAKYYVDNKNILNKKEWQNIKRDDFKMQSKGAMEIATLAGLNFDVPVNQEALEKLQSVLTDYQLIVIDGAYRSNIIYKGKEENKNKIYIEYLNEHFNVITNIRGYMGKKFFCQKCHVAYRHFQDHKCSDQCDKCYSNCDKEEKVNITCTDCWRVFNGQDCYNRHLSTKLCTKIKVCPECEVIHKDYGIKHVCGKYFCKNCGKHFTEQPHFCYVKPKNENDLRIEDEMTKIIFSYDIESMHERGEHIPMLLINKTCCDLCHGKNIENCEICLSTFNIYFGEDCIKRFVDFLFEDLAKRAERNNVFIYTFAHNARGYDAHFILREMWKKFYNEVKITMNGIKILKIEVANVKMVDSLSFFLQPLSSLPKAFGLDVNIEKGTFPHLFNTRDHWEYNGEIPDIEFYSPDYMKKDVYEKFEKWYKEQKEKNVKFNFKEELIRYCKNDVEILSLCLMKFRDEFKKITQLDPITRCFTLASIGLEVFKSKYLREGLLGVTPVKGYNATRNHSTIAEIWLDWMQKKDETVLKREYRIGKYWVDGYSKENNSSVEFYKVVTRC